MNKTQPRRIHSGYLIPLIFVLVFVWLLIELYLSNNVIKSQNITYASEKIPERFNDYTIVHLSDLHEKTFGTDNHKLLSAVREAQPDMIAITGDVYDSAQGLSYAQNVCGALAEIAPVYYVTGNHEWAAEWENPEDGSLIVRARKLFDDIGVFWLDSRAIQLHKGDDSVIIAGLCDPNGPLNRMGLGQLSKAARNEFGQNFFFILLSHRYDMFDLYRQEKVDLVLTGHSHGGVMRIPFTDGLVGPGGELMPKRTAGVYTEGDTTMIVSRGLGETHLPRFLNRPDLTVITLKSQK
ncbi:MAG: metallophosphoesterase [Oscillospiraceae bacterium]|nr:metallophosphoesterase [Oscillospiraceae bacterium]